MAVIHEAETKVMLGEVRRGEEVASVFSRALVHRLQKNFSFFS